MLDNDRHRLSELDTLPLDPLRQAHRMEVILREYGNSKRCASSVGWGVSTAHIARLERLRADIREGLNSGNSRAWSAEETKREGRARRASKPA
jgi:hypothetical protein